MTAEAVVGPALVAGIDVAEARKGIDLVVLDEERLIVEKSRGLSIRSVTEMVLRIRPSFVCIDSPSSWSLSGKSRLAERELMKLGISAFATPTDPGDHPFYRWMRSGFAIYEALAPVYPRFNGGDVSGTAAEVFPAATAAILAGRHRAGAETKNRFRRSVLAAHGVDERLLSTMDQVDAALAALTGLAALDRHATWVGDPAEGVILLPHTLGRGLTLAPVVRGRSQDGDRRANPARSEARHADTAAAHDEELAEALAVALTPVVGPGVAVGDLTRLSGGASRVTWRFTAATNDSSRTRYLILRSDPVGGTSSTLPIEAALLKSTKKAGVPVPDVLTVVPATDPPGPLGVALITKAIEGETIPRRVLRDDTLAYARANFATRCGEILAAIHSIPVGDVPDLPDTDTLQQLRSLTDHFAQPHPVLELAFRALEEERPRAAPALSQPVVVHGDFRLGNLVIGPDGIRAVLNWELSHRGDPTEDLAWLCIRAWRFGGALPVGGIGERADLLAAYEAASGATVDPDRLRWCDLLATLRWGVTCIVQAFTHLSGARRSVELATIGRRVCEVEWDLLDLLESAWVPPSPSSASAPDPAVAASGVSPPSELHDAPTAAELVDAVSEFLTNDVMAATDGSLRYHARVAANALAMVQRELTLGSAPALAHADALRALGFAGNGAMARAIRCGSIDWRDTELRSVLRNAVASKLAVANPAYGAAPSP